METAHSPSQVAQQRLLLVRISFWLIALGMIGIVPGANHARLAAQSGRQWYKVDTHVHSVISSDAPADIGIMSKTGKDNGYDALFLTDHNGASSFHINRLTANYMTFDDTYARWELGNFGKLSSSTNVLTTSPVNTSSRSLHLQSTSSSYGETFIVTKRGSNLRSGDIIINVSIFPVQIDPNSGAYISVSLGGDPSYQKTPIGYTTQDGVISPGKSIVLVWQIGSPRVVSMDSTERVIVNDLPYTLNQWNHYTINVTDALVANISAADRPLDYNGLTDLKMAVAADNGSAEAYFDTYKIEASAPVAPADEFLYRTSVVDDFDTATFKVYPSFEAGQQRHTQRFNFGITAPEQYRSYLYGTDSIPETHQSGYPAQLNHPGTTTAVADAISTHAYGADVLENRDDEWIATWDKILQQNVPLVGSWSSDTHTGISPGRPATYLYASSLSFDALMKAHFEGRSYNARNNFPGRVLFDLGSTALEPHPARYPVYVSDAPGAIDVSLAINSGVDPSWTITWFRNGQVVTTDKPGDSSYLGTKAIALDGTPVYVRAEARKSSDSLHAATQAILFRPIASLPAGRSIHVEEVTNTTSNGYNNESVRGITSATWGSTFQLLQVTMENPANALVSLKMSTEVAPMRVRLGQVEVWAATSLAEFHTATDNRWFYESTASLLHLKIRHATTSVQFNVEFGNSGDTLPPSVPENVVATAASLAQIDLSWSASTDNLGVAGYIIYRDGAELATVAGSKLSYSDIEVQPSTSYTYRVVAFDTSSNHSEQSAPATAVTPNSSTFTFNAVADSYVVADKPTNNYGRTTSLRLDASPDTRGYVRFELSGLVGQVQQATLHIYANSGSSTGYRIHGVSDTSWTETGITYDNAPGLGEVVATSGLIGANSWTSVDVTSLIIGNGQLNLGLSTTNNTAMSLASRENIANIARLSITIGSGEVEEPPPSGTFHFNPVADSYVTEANPTTNYGRATTLRTDASPVTLSYLRFSVENMGGTVEQATLHIYANSGSNIGYQVQTVIDGSWTETGITYSNAPALGSVAGVSGMFSSGTWTAVDVTSLVTNNGVLDLALSGTSNTAISIASRENSANVPELFITTSNGVAAASNQSGLDIALFDSWRTENGLNPDDNVGDSSALADPDGDGLTNLDEFVHHTNPLQADSDNDTLPDQWEVERELDPTDGIGDNGSDGDPNGDGSTNAADFANDSQLNQVDSDGDGLPNAWEQAYSLDHMKNDGDNGAGGDPDGEELENINEWLNNTDPHSTDSDGDSLPDLWEVETGLSPSDGSGDNGASGDPDGDGILNRGEYEADSDPYHDDTQEANSEQFFLPRISR